VRAPKPPPIGGLTMRTFAIGISSTCAIIRCT
jgi:hypothetical protein